MEQNDAKKRTRNRRKKPLRPRGQKKAFTPQQIAMLGTFLRESRSTHAKRDYALMRMAVDTMLRSVDLLNLTFGHVLHEGEVVDRFSTSQRKTEIHGEEGHIVTCHLTAETNKALWDYIGAFAEYIREDRTRRIFPITGRRYHYLVGEWCEWLKLDKTKYATHSFRRTKAAHIYRTTKNIAAIKELLGHTTLQYTERYLGVDREDALILASEVII